MSEPHDCELDLCPNAERLARVEQAVRLISRRLGIEGLVSDLSQPQTDEVTARLHRELAAAPLAGPFSRKETT